jgi:hypothetical protein
VRIEELKRALILMASIYYVRDILSFGEYAADADSQSVIRKQYSGGIIQGFLSERHELASQDNP